MSLEKVKKALKQPRFRWLPKHLHHIAENIALKKRNISFLAINALFRSNTAQLSDSGGIFKDSYIIKGFVPLQKNDGLRTKAENLFVIFRLDKHDNIIVITAYSESDGE